MKEKITLMNNLLSKYSLTFNDLLNYKGGGVDGFINDVQTQITHWDYWKKYKKNYKMI